MLRPLHRLLDRLFMIEYWTLGICEVDGPELVRCGRVGPVRWCRDRSMGSFRADPFVWRGDKESRVIYEQFDYWRGHGLIASISIDDLLAGGPVRREIDGPLHYSYPFIFRSDGEWYCMPECAESRGVSLYRWCAETQSWAHARRLLDGLDVLDPTLLRRHGIWYLFGTLRHDEPNAALRAWWSANLTGPWNPHASNPVKRDPAGSRPAGPFFHVGDHLYRPAQDSRCGYGSAITINRVDTLSPDEFSETAVSRLVPDADGAYPDGIHSICIDGDLAIVDGKTRRFHAAAGLLKSIWWIRARRRR